MPGMNNPPQIMLKAIVIGHFILTFWGSMSPLLMTTQSYIYLNAFTLAFGFWAIVQAESPEPVLMYLILHLISIIQDVILLGIFATAGSANVERPGVAQSTKDLYRFSLGMAILDLILKPVTGFLLFRILQSRSGDYSEFNIPGVSNFPGFAPSTGYENIDQPSPYRNNVETATGHDTMEKPPGEP